MSAQSCSRDRRSRPGAARASETGIAPSARLRRGKSMPATTLVATCNRLERGAAHLRLITHSLDLQILLLGVGDDSFDFPFQLYNRSLLLFDSAVLFEELIEQH